MGRGAALRQVVVQTGVITRLAAAAYVVQAYVANFTISVGPSMQPTLPENGDIMLVESITPRVWPVQPGEVIIATKPTSPRTTILKRVATPPTGISKPTWCPGDENEHESSLKRGTGQTVWLEGDNPTLSTDSRHYGLVPYTLVRSRVVCRVWPPSRFGQLPPAPNKKEKKVE